MQQKFSDLLKQNRNILLICLLGLLARMAYVVLFSSFFARAYLGRETLFYAGSDFGTSLLAFNNLWQHGTYSVNLADTLGAFNRMPGYSFFIGIISLIFPQPYNMYVVSGAQIILDCFVIFLVYQILKQRFKVKESYSLIGAMLYAVYPIAIIWTPVLFSDSIGAFFSFLILYVYLDEKKSNRHWLKLGLVIGMAMLFRPTALLSILVIGLIELTTQLKQLKVYSVSMLFMGLGILFTYGLYPARNIILHHKFVLFQDLRGSGSCWNEATVNYMQYVYSVQSHWEPTWSSVIQNKPLEIDKAAYAVPGDSAILQRAIANAQKGSYSFSCWDGYWAPRRGVEGLACDSAIAADFALLREHQMKYNAYHFWLVLPLENLKKCLFKSEISHNKNQSIVAKLVPIVFYYRTLLLLLGVIACIVSLRRRQHNKAVLFILLSFLSWYLLISAGTMAQLRNIEMRYLLPVDVLLILPVVLLLPSKKEDKSAI